MCVLFLILTGLNFIYTISFYKTDLKEKSPELIQIRETEGKTDVYYFGESSNVSYKKGDSIIESISEITSLFFPTLKFTNVNKYATHAGVYKQWIKQFKKLPKAVIVTLNLRSFDAAWIHSKLETQLSESLVFSYPYPNLVNRFLLALGNFDNQSDKQREEATLRDWKTIQLQFPFPFKYKTTSEWDAGMAAGSYLKPDGSWDTEKIVLACHYVKGYAFNMSETNPRIEDFDQIVQWCTEKKVRLYLNLMAENINYADSLVGKELVFLMKQNRDYLVKRYTKGNCVVVDNLELVNGNEFIDQNWTTEHYDYKGRMKIAKNLATQLKKQFEKDYKSAY